MRRKRARAAQAAPPPQKDEQGPPSVWQSPHAVFLNVLEQLLAMPDGPKHVRLASHVCHHWRVAAQEVLLADTAISKPPMEDFRAIGQQHPLPAPKQQKQETVTTQAAVVIEASASTGMEAISKQRFDGPPGAFPTSAGALGRGLPGRPAQPQAAPRPTVGAGFAAAPPDVRRQHQRAALQNLARSLAQQAQQQAHQAQQQAQQAQQQAQQAQQQAQQQVSAGPGSTVPAAPAAAAGASPSAQQAGAAEAPQGSIQSGMAMIGQRHTAALESESDGGSTRARGPNKRRRVRRSSEPSCGRGLSVEQPVRQPQQVQQAQQAQQPAGTIQRGAPGQQAAAPAVPAPVAAPDEAGTTRPSSRRRRRSVSTAGEEEVSPSKRQQAAGPRKPSRSGLRSSGPASGEGLPDTQRQRSQQAQQAQQQVGQQQAQQAQQASEQQRQRPSRTSSEQHTAAPQAEPKQPERQADEEGQPVQVPAGKPPPTEPVAASGSYCATAEDGAEVEQHVPPQPVAGEDGEGPWERPEAGEGGLQAAFSLVCRFLRLRD